MSEKTPQICRPQGYLCDTCGQKTPIIYGHKEKREFISECEKCYLQ